MAKRVILAVAGAGKTYHICHTIDPSKRNLILAFTHENIFNIQKELCAAFGCIPEMTTVTTFDSFVYHYLVLPYEPSIAEHFGFPNFTSHEISTVAPPPLLIPKTKRPNPYYVKKDNLKHYITKNQQYYCATLSELALQVKQEKDSLIKRSANRLNLFFDCILIDEFQDFRNYDYELIMLLSKQLRDIVLVGDYHQHSVSGVNNSGKPFKLKNKDINYADFITHLQKLGFTVDLTTLEKSRRCSSDICRYVSKKLGIHIESCGINSGSVIWADRTAQEILENNHIVKLVNKNSANYTFRAMNWSYSKGDTVDEACVILTENLENLDKDTFSASKLSTVTLNQLYVAMTRCRGNLYLIKYSTFKKLKEQYLCNNSSNATLT